MAPVVENNPLTITLSESLSASIRQAARRQNISAERFIESACECHINDADTALSRARILDEPLSDTDMLNIDALMPYLPE